MVLAVMDQRLPIAIITNSCPPYRSALHHRLVRELPIEVHSLFTHEWGDVTHAFRDMPDIRPLSFGAGENFLEQDRPGRALHEWKKAGKILKWIQENGIRVVVVGGYNDIGRLRIMRWCHRHRVPCLMQADSNIHSDRATGLRAWAKRQLLGKVVGWCDAILVCGRLGREYFLKYGSKPESLFISPYEPDYALIQSLTDQTIQQTQQRFSLDPKRRRIVYSGRLISIKRVDLVIDAFAAIAGHRPEWDLVIVGDGVLREELKSRVPEAIRNRVQWTGFLDDQAAISAIYRLSDVLVLASDHEPWAVVINEAVAAGMAIVASNVVGAAAELVQDGVNGKVFPPGDLAEFSRCLLDVTDSGKIDAMKRASADVLADWRRRGDPVEGFRRALEYTKAL